MGRGKRNNTDVSRREADFMQLLRSLRVPVTEICKLTQYTPDTIYRHTDSRKIPITDYPTTGKILLGLVTQAAIEAHKAWDSGAALSEHKELALTIDRYANTLRTIEEIAAATTSKALIEDIEKLWAREDIPDDVKEAMQPIYNGLINRNR